MTSLAVRLAAVALLAACPFACALARSSASPYQSPQHASRVACEKEARDQQIKGWWARHKYISKCVAARERLRSQQ
jgi:hypothetical protein